MEDPLYLVVVEVDYLFPLQEVVVVDHSFLVVVVEGHPLMVVEEVQACLDSLQEGEEVAST